MKRLLLYITSILITFPVSAQYYMNVFPKNGQKIMFVVAELDSISFSDQSESSVDYEYVDLGLSVNWATHNVGAGRFVEDYGDFYAWGETEPKSEYSWATYKYSNRYGYLTKYNNNSNNGYNGYTDNITKLDLVDDVAHVEWGGNWRLPTSAEFEELKYNCTWIWTNQNGVNGYKITSNISDYTDRSIFLPAAGVNYVPTSVFTDDTNTDFAGSSLGYWSSSLYADNPIGAKDIYYNIDERQVDGYTPRFFGQTVRPVCPSSTYQGTTKFSIFEKQMAVIIGDEYKLNAMLHSDKKNYSFIPDLIVWSSSDQSVVTVDENGVVTANSIGVATITATAEIGSLKDSCTIIVTSLSPTGSENSYGYVDLGLSVKWATFNIGASAIEDYGDYFAWGETVPYYENGYARENSSQILWKDGKTDGYSWSSYKYCNGSSSTLTKYNNNSSYGTVDNKATLEPEDDAAHVNWDGCWRMPTQAEFDELCNTDNCMWTWLTHNGVYGVLVSSKKTGYSASSIFLPVTGARAGTGFAYTNYLCYWSSSLNTDYPERGWFLGWLESKPKNVAGDRPRGLTVRPVCP